MALSCYWMARERAGANRYKYMINETYDSLKEAKERARLLLWNDLPQGAKEAVYTTTTSDAWDGLRFKPYTITIDGSESYALILHSVSEWKGRKHETARLTYIGANDKQTYPFRNLKKQELPFIVMLNRIATYIKPVEPITAEEAATAAGEERIRHFFGTDYERFTEQAELLEAIRRGEKEAFYTEEWDEEESYLRAAEINPSALSNAVGKPVRSLKDYHKATEALIGRSLNDEERDAQIFPYYFHRVETFGLYCLYCFLLSERYADLTNAIKQYSVFGLPKGWQKDDSMNFGAEMVEQGETMEEAVLNRYFDLQSFRFICPVDLSEIAAYTGAPLKLLSDVMDESATARRIRRRFNKMNP